MVITESKAGRNVRNWKMVVNVLLLILWSGLLGYGIAINFFSIRNMNMIYYAVSSAELGLFELVVAMSFGGGMIYLLYYWINRSKAGDIVQFNLAMLPLLLLIPEFFLPIGVYTPIIFIAVAGLTAFRYCCLLQNAKETRDWTGYEPSRKKLLLLIIGLVSVAFIAYGYYLQKKAMDTLLLAWYDWGYFMGCLRSTLNGNWFYVNNQHTNFMGSRFCIGLTILLPYVYMFDSVEAFLLMNSVVLASGGIIIYCIAKKLKFSSFEGFIFAIMYFLTPGIINLNLTNYYSFHEVYFAIPFILLSFLFYSSEKYITAFIFFFLSMTFKETIPVLWGGIGAIFIIQRRHKAGIIILVVSIAYFFGVQKLIIPWIRDGKDYICYYRFAHLGSNMFEIVLSPIMRPEAFWGHLFRPGTFYLIALLLLPAFILLLSYPLMLLACGVVFVFICVQDSNQMQNIVLQYQTMLLITVFCTQLENYKKLKDNAVSPVYRIFSFGQKLDLTSQSLKGPVLGSCLLLSAMSWLFFGQSHISKNDVKQLLAGADCTKPMEEFKKFIPPGVPLTASSRVATHFFTRNNVFYDYNPKGKYPLQDYVLIDIMNPDFLSDMLKLRDYLLESDEYALEHVIPYHSHLFMLFKKGGNKKWARSVVKADQLPAWKNGMAMTSGEKDFSIKLILIKIQGKKVARFMIKKERDSDYDIVVNFSLNNGKRTMYWKAYFGHGYQPASKVKPGYVYVYDAVLPGDFDVLREGSFSIRKLNY